LALHETAVSTCQQRPDIRRALTERHARDPMNTPGLHLRPTLIFTIPVSRFGQWCLPGPKKRERDEKG
jgi:hypothetical protein